MKVFNKYRKSMRGLSILWTTETTYYRPLLIQIMQAMRLRSTVGMIIMMNGGPISWGSVLGKTVALSTFEAEVNAACMAAKDALHLSRLLKDMGITKGKKNQINLKINRI